MRGGERERSREREREVRRERERERGQEREREREWHFPANGLVTASAVVLAADAFGSARQVRDACGGGGSKRCVREVVR